MPISSMRRVRNLLRDGALPTHTQDEFLDDNFIQPAGSLDPSCTVVGFMETPRWARFEVQDQVLGDGLRSWAGLRACKVPLYVWICYGFENTDGGS